MPEFDGATTMLLAAALMMRRSKREPLTEEQKEAARVREQVKEELARKAEAERVASEREEMLRSPRAYRRRQAKLKQSLDGDSK